MTAEPEEVSLTRADYDELATYSDGAAWANGPQPVYDRLASSALAGLPGRLDGLKAVDVGAGTGAATRELLRRGAHVLAADLSTAMLAELVRQTGGRVPTVATDIRRLALPDDEYDVAVAAFVLNHLEDAAAGVRELVRVTKPSGKVVATTFGADEHPIKAATDDVLARYGYEPPRWYRVLKQVRMPRIAAPVALTQVGIDGGLVGAAVDQVDVDFSDLPVDAAVAYRLGVPHIASFVVDLDAGTRAQLEAELASVVAALPPLHLDMLVLSGRG